MPEPRGEVQSNPSLLAIGWERRFLVGPDRAEEAIENYQNLGYEVFAETLGPESFGDGCSSCSSTVCESYVLIYTRMQEPPSND